MIGLPGDHVVCCDKNGQLTINGVSITEPYIKPGDTPGGGKASFDITVPPGKVWVMGDHRSDSSDSRFHDDGTGATGSVPIEDITGRSVMIVWPIDHVKWLSVPERVYSDVPPRLRPTGPDPGVHGRHRLSGRPPAAPEALAARRARAAAGRSSGARRDGRGGPRRARRPGVGRGRRHRRDLSVRAGRGEGLQAPHAPGPAAHGRPIQRWARAYAVGHSSPAEIDEIGIMGGLRLAGMRALASMRRRASCPTSSSSTATTTGSLHRTSWGCWPSPTRAPVGAAGDDHDQGRHEVLVGRRSLGIAKVERDGLMVSLDADHPAYGWAVNKGYAAPEHMLALEAHGPCVQHRRSWRLPRHAEPGGAAGGRGGRTERAGRS